MKKTFEVVDCVLLLLLLLSIQEKEPLVSVDREEVFPPVPVLAALLLLSLPLPLGQLILRAPFGCYWWSSRCPNAVLGHSFSEDATLLLGFVSLGVRLLNPTCLFHGSLVCFNPLDFCLLAALALSPLGLLSLLPLGVGLLDDLERVFSEHLSIDRC